MHTTEEVSPSKFISETLDKKNYSELLKQEDIARIARFCYSWYGPGSEVLFEAIGSESQFDVKLREGKNELEKDGIQSLTFIINLKRYHWVALVITYKESNFIAYHIDGLGFKIDDPYKKILEGHNIIVEDFMIKQQDQLDYYNCGIFSLENSKIINDNIDECKETIVQKLRDYQPKPIDLKEKRKNFAEVLRSQSCLKRKSDFDFVNVQRDEQGVDATQKFKIFSSTETQKSEVECMQESQSVIQYNVKRRLYTDNTPIENKKARSNGFGSDDDIPVAEESKSYMILILKIFVKSFCEQFQEKLKDYWDEVMKKKPKQPSVLSRLCTLGLLGGMVKLAAPIGVLGATIGGNFVDFFANKFGESFHVKKAKKVVKNLSNFQVGESEIRRVLVRAAVNIFHNYEGQYIKIIREESGNEQFLIKQLAKDTVLRVMSYIDSQKDDIKTQSAEQYLKELYNLLTKGVALSKSTQKYLSKKSIVHIRSFLVMDNINSMYNATGIVKIANDGTTHQYYTKQNKSCDIKKYGYRLAFQWELEDPLDGWKLEENAPKMQYKYTLKPEEIEGEVDEILKELSGKSNVLKSDLEIHVKEISEIADRICNMRLTKGNVSLRVNSTQKSVLPNTGSLVRSFALEDETLKKGVLEISYGEQEDDIKKLQEELSVPLALRLAQTYIDHEKEKLRKRGVDKFGSRDYLKKYQDENLLDFTFGNDDNLKDVKILARACNITLKKIKEEGDLGSKALQIIEIMAYVDSNKVSIKEVFSKLVLDDEKKLWDSLELLEKYSMINLEFGQSSIDRLLQEVIRSKLRKKNSEKEVLEKVLQLTIDITDASQANHIVSIWSYCVGESNELIKPFISKFNRFCDKDRSSLLRLLIRNNQSKAVQRILHSIDDDVLNGIINYVGEVGDSFLSFVITKNARDVVEYLIEKKGVDFNAKDNYGITLVHLAAANNARDVVEYLIEKKGVDFNAKDNYGITLVHLAAANNARDVVEYLIEKKGVDFNAKDNYGITLVHLAAANNALDVVEYLIEKRDVNFNAKDNYGTTPIYVAAWCNALDVVEYLIEKKGVDFNAKDNYGVALIHFAAMHNARAVVEYLVGNKNVAFSSLGSLGMTPLHFAAWCNAPDVIEYLIDKYTGIFNYSSRLGQSLLELAVSSNALNALRCLINKGVEFNPEDHNGQSLLEFAIMTDRSNIVEYFIEEKNVVDLKDSGRAMNLLYSAAKNNARDIVKYLIENKKVVDLEDKNAGGKLLFSAVEEDALDVVRYLMENKKVVDHKKNDRILLNFALLYDALHVMKYLIENKKVVDLEDKKEGKEFLRLAIKEDALNIVKYLIEDQKVVDLNNHGRSVLELVLKYDELDILKYLVENKKVVTLEDKNAGRELLCLALKKNALNIVKYLIENQKIVDLNNHGRTVLELACKCHASDVVKYLVEDKGIVNPKNPEDCRSLNDKVESHFHDVELKAVKQVSFGINDNHPAHRKRSKSF